MSRLQVWIAPVLMKSSPVYEIRLKNTACVPLSIRSLILDDCHCIDPSTIDKHTYYSSTTFFSFPRVKQSTLVHLVQVPNTLRISVILLNHSCPLLNRCLISSMSTLHARDMRIIVLRILLIHGKSVLSDDSSGKISREANMIMKSLPSLDLFPRAIHVICLCKHGFNSIECHWYPSFRKSFLILESLS